MALRCGDGEGGEDSSISLARRRKAGFDFSLLSGGLDDDDDEAAAAVASELLRPPGLLFSQ